MDAQALIKRAEQTHRLTENEIVHILQDEAADAALFSAADRVRKKYVGDEVHLRALIEFTNICRNGCLYCGLRAPNSRVTRYRMTPRQILTLAQKAAQEGYKTIVLQGGEDPYFTADILTPLLRQIKSLDMAITLSIGERSYEDYAAFKEAGADRYLLRIETTDRALYEKYNNRSHSSESIPQSLFPESRGSIHPCRIPARGCSWGSAPSEAPPSHKAASASRRDVLPQKDPAYTDIPSAA